MRSLTQFSLAAVAVIFAGLNGCSSSEPEPAAPGGATTTPAGGEKAAAPKAPTGPDDLATFISRFPEETPVIFVAESPERFLSVLTGVMSSERFAALPEDFLSDLTEGVSDIFGPGTGAVHERLNAAVKEYGVDVSKPAGAASAAEEDTEASVAFVAISDAAAFQAATQGANVEEFEVEVNDETLKGGSVEAEQRYWVLDNGYAIFASSEELVEAAATSRREPKALTLTEREKSLAGNAELVVCAREAAMAGIVTTPESDNAEQQQDDFGAKMQAALDRGMGFIDMNAELSEDAIHMLAHKREGGATTPPPAAMALPGLLGANNDLLIALGQPGEVMSVAKSVGEITGGTPDGMQQAESMMANMIGNELALAARFDESGLPIIKMAMDMKNPATFQMLLSLTGSKPVDKEPQGETKVSAVENPMMAMIGGAVYFATVGKTVVACTNEAELRTAIDTLSAGAAAGADAPNRFMLQMNAGKVFSFGSTVGAMLGSPTPSSAELTAALAAAPPIAVTINETGEFFEVEAKSVLGLMLTVGAHAEELDGSAPADEAAPAADASTES